MLDPQGSRLHSVAWSELLPWLILLRCFRLALRPSMLVLAAAGVFLTALGWSLLAHLPIEGGLPQVGRTLEAVTAVVPDHPGLPVAMSTTSGSQPLAERQAGPWGHLVEPVYGSWEQLSRPWVAMFAEGHSFGGTVQLGLCGLWALIVWAFFGAAITRMAAVELAAEERIGLGAVLRFARDKWFSFLAAPLVSLGFVLVIAVVLAVASWVLQWWILAVLWGLLWGLFLVGGALMAVFLLGLLLGGPLMWPTIATEGTDGFDAWSRAHSYLFERPLHYLFYAVVAFAFGLVSWLLVANVTAVTIHMSYWAASGGVGTDWMQQLAQGTGDLGFFSGIGSWLIRLWTGVLKLAAVGFLFSYFWSAATAVYLLMRQKVDGAEMDEISLDEDQEEPYGLPPLKTDAAGVPLVDDEE